MSDDVVNPHDEVVETVARESVDLNEFGVRIKRHLSWDAYLDKLASRNQFEDGSERPDPRPMQPPLGYQRQPSMVEHIRAMVRSEQMRLAAELEGYESFEEADDFDLDDGDGEPWSKYEMDDDMPSVGELRRRLAEAEARAAAAPAEAGAPGKGASGPAETPPGGPEARPGLPEPGA